MALEIKEVGIDGLKGDFSQVPGKFYPPELAAHIHQPSLRYFFKGFVFYVDGQPLGRYVLYNNEEIEVDSNSVVCLGSFEASDHELALSMLDHAKAEVKESGISKILGPMEGSTWSSYRFSSTIGQPPFLTEKIHQEFYLKSFKASGFKTLATYESRLIKLDKSIHTMPQPSANISNLNFRTIDIENLEDELMRIGSFCIEAFSQNYLYSSMSAETFTDQYMGLKNIMNPELIMIVEDESNEICAIMFAIDDLMSLSGKKAVLKTLARKKGPRFSGLGKYLSELTHFRLQQLGYESIMHAFMMSTNPSSDISANLNSDLYRQYELLMIDL